MATRKATTSDKKTAKKAPAKKTPAKKVPAKKVPAKKGTKKPSDKKKAIGNCAPKYVSCIINSIKIIYKKKASSLPNRDTYTASYDSLLAFGNKETLEQLKSYKKRKGQKLDNAFNSLIILAHAVYGWMPTILDILPKKPKTKKVDRDVNLKEWKDAVVTKCCKLLDSPSDYENHKEEYQLLSQFTNNSYVGLSKFLHFLFPKHYAIWDSNIFRALREGGCKTVFSSQENNLNNFIKYQCAMHDALKNSDLKKQIRPLSLRNIEISLFYIGKALNETNKNKKK